MNDTSEHNQLNIAKMKVWCTQETSIRLANWIWLVSGFFVLIILLGALD